MNARDNSAENLDFRSKLSLYWDQLNNRINKLIGKESKSNSKNNDDIELTNREESADEDIIIAGINDADGEDIVIKGLENAERDKKIN